MSRQIQLFDRTIHMLSDTLNMNSWAVRNLRLIEQQVYNIETIGRHFHMPTLN